MLDLRLRPVKDRALAGVAERLGVVFGPGTLTLAGLALTLGAAGAAWAGLSALAVVGWLAGRLLDGLDGPVARARNTADDLGGYQDLLADTIGYVAIPLGVALAVDSRAGWIAVAVLLGAFWVNGMSWAYLAAILEKRGSGAAANGEVTSVTMQPALVEGTETIVFFTVFLALPSLAPWLFSAMAALVAVNVVQRLAWASGHLTAKAGRAT